MRKVRTSKVLKDFGQWVVTTYGVECVETYYPIAKKRLWENEGVYPWERHMAEKNWVNTASFEAAMEYARNYFGLHIGGVRDQRRIRRAV